MGPKICKELSALGNGIADACLKFKNGRPSQLHSWYSVEAVKFSGMDILITS